MGPLGIVCLQMKKFFFIAAIAALMVGLTCSCSHRITDFTVISTKNYPTGSEAAYITKAQTRVKGVDRKHTILFIPLGMPNLKEAIDKAIEKYPGAVGLCDGVVKSTGFNALLYGQSAYVVEGTPLYLDSNNTTSQGNVNVEQVRNNTQGGSIMFYHEVKTGEQLSDIARQYNVTMGDIIKWNKLSSNSVKAGDKILIYLKD